MKTLALSLIIAATLASCTTTTNVASTATDRDAISWAAFCKEFGYKVSDHSQKATNDYLDCWRGSAAEEEALAQHGIIIND